MNDWKKQSFADAFLVNPLRYIKRGDVVPHMAMEYLQPFTRRITNQRLKEYTGSGSRFQNGDTLLARITPCLENGKTAFVDCLEHGAAAHGSTEFIVISGRPEVSDSLFAYYYVASSLFRDYAIQSMSGSSGRQRVPNDAVSRYEVALPSLSEQRAIAAILGALDDKIECNRRMNATLEQIAQALFQSWFVDFEPVRDNIAGKASSPLHALYPSDFEDSNGHEIPQGWEVSTIGAETDVVGGGTPSTKEPKFWDDGAHFWATPKDLSALGSPVLLRTERKVTDVGLKQISSGLLPVGAVLLSSRAPIGYLVFAGVPVAINQGFIALICREVLSNYYVFHWVKQNMEQIKARANGTTFLEISKSNFRPLQVVVPPIPILQQFNLRAKAIFERIAENDRENRDLATTRDFLLPRLLSGEVRVSEALQRVHAQNADVKAVTTR